MRRGIWSSVVAAAAFGTTAYAQQPDAARLLGKVCTGTWDPMRRGIHNLLTGVPYASLSVPLCRWEARAKVLSVKRRLRHPIASRPLLRLVH